MANDVNGNPLIIDTVSAADLMNGQLVPIKIVRWTSPSAASGHRVIITNAAGRIIWEAVANGSAYAEVDHLDLRDGEVGLKVPTLDSGRLLIYML